ncbi:MAG: IS630 family transposase [Candidatus Eisenbacteria bacterium]
MRPYGDARTLERRRLKAVNLLSKGLGPGEIAKQLGVDRRSVHRWLAAYRDHGMDGLAPVPVPGRPHKLSGEKRKKLAGMLLEGATAFGYPTDLWTGPRVVDLVRRRFRVSYHANHISRLLRSLGFSPQRPERRARERDEVAIRSWVRDQWPRVKKTPGD